METKKIDYFQKKEITDPEMVSKLRHIASQALERAEKLKSDIKKVTVSPMNSEIPKYSNKLVFLK